MPRPHFFRGCSGEERANPALELPEARQALDRLFRLTYEELRLLASSVKRGDPSSTLSPTALVTGSLA